MKIKCQTCGAEASLDLLIANDSAADALNAAIMINGALGKLLIQYLGLFRPKKTALTMQRVAKLLNEINQDIANQSIMRDGIKHDAPTEAWIYAISEMLKMRELGKLKTPITSHGYLYEVIAGFRHSDAAKVILSTQKTADAISNDQARRGRLQYVQMHDPNC